MTTEDDRGVELILPDGDAETNKPLILPARAGMKMTAAQRRWRLLKNLMVASKRKTSLTKSEEDFLETLDKPTDMEGPKSSTEEEEALGKARQDLLDRIESKGHTLTAAEEAFLTYLAECPHVTSDYLIRSSQVLLHDPLYTLDEAKEEPVAQSEVKPMLRQRDASFRSEVWTHFSSSSLMVEDSTRSSRHEEEIKDQKKEQEPQMGKKKSNGFMYKFFFKRKDKIEENVEEQQQHFDTYEENPVEFSILATSAEDIDCQPHVLSPPYHGRLACTLALCCPTRQFLAQVFHGSRWCVHEGALAKSSIISSYSNCY
jgi:hypothetical protein